EITIFERVVFDVDGQALDGGVQGRALGHRPADQHAVDLEPKVVVEAPGFVALYDIAQRALRRPGRRPSARFFGDSEVALPTIGFQPGIHSGHLAQVVSCSRLRGRSRMYQAVLRRVPPDDAFLAAVDAFLAGARFLAAVPGAFRAEAPVLLLAPPPLLAPPRSSMLR